MASLVIRLRQQLGHLRQSYVVVPLAALMLSVLASVGLVAIDRAVSGNFTTGGWAFDGGPEAARSVLSAISSSMITFTGLVFSITIVSLQLTSSQFSPRALRSFLEDRVNQSSLAVFLATFAYALMTLRTVRGSSDIDAFVPGLAMTGALMLVACSAVMFVVYIHHTVQSLRAITIISRISEETRKSISSLFPLKSDAHEVREDDGVIELRRTPDEAIETRLRRGRVLSSVGHGVVTFVSTAELAKAAARAETSITVVPEVGQFVPRGGPLVVIDTPDAFDDDAERQKFHENILGLIALDRSRTMLQDPVFGFRQLIDIAEKALSPGINDPTTAVQCIDEIHDLLRDLSGREMGSGAYVTMDSTDVVRLRMRTWSWPEVLELSTREILHWGETSLQVHERLGRMFADLYGIVLGDDRAAVEHQLERLRSIRSSLDPAVRSALEARIAEDPANSIGASPFSST